MYFLFICLDIGFWQSSFVWRCCIFNLSTFNLKTPLQFFETFFCSAEIFFKVKELKMFKISSDCRKKNRWLFLKSQRASALSVGFKQNLSEKYFPVLRQKKTRSSKASILIDSSTELIKTQFPLRVSLKVHWCRF